MTLPDSFAVALDARAVRPVEDVVIRAAPGAAVRVTPAGVSALDVLLSGGPIRDAAEKAGADVTSLVRTLLDAGIVHPRPAGVALGEDDVTVVVPARDAATTIGEMVRSLDPLPVVVVDDGSTDGTADVARQAGATSVRHERSLGPAAARNRGAAIVTTPLVAFLDADCRPRPDWLVHLVAHFDDPLVGAVAPRIVGDRPSPSLLSRYETARSVLDQGPHESGVGPDAERTLVPTAALVVRRTALDAVGGLDEALRFGEDQDLVDRLAAAGWRVRYEPRSEVGHDHRTRAGAFVTRRFRYGTPAALLALRHGTLHAAVRLPRPAPTVALHRDLLTLGVAPDDADVITRATVRRTARTVAHAATRVWLPVAAVAAARSRRARVALTVAVVVRHLGDWRRRRPPVGAAQWVALRSVDEAALASGIWWGAARARSVVPLLPAIGRRPAVTDGDRRVVERVVWLP